MNKGTAIVGFFLCFLAGMGLMWGIDRSKGVAIGPESGDTGTGVRQVRSDTVCSSESKASLPEGRSAGSFESRRMMRASSSRGTSSRTSRRGGGCSRRTLARTAMTAARR